MQTSLNLNFSIPVTTPTVPFPHVEEIISQEKDKIGEKYQSLIKNITDPNGINILSRMCQLFQSKLDDMLKRGCSAKEIRDAANNGIKELDRIGDLFSTNTSIFHNQVNTLNHQWDAIDRNLKNRPSSIEFFSFDEHPHLQTMLMQMPGYAEQRDDMLGLMSLARGAAAVANFASEGLQGILDETGSNVQHRARAICNKNPLIQNRCRQIKNLPSNAITGLNEVIESSGRTIESKLTAFCNNNPANRKICQTALNLTQGFGKAVQDSEPPLKSAPILQNLPQYRFSFELAKSTKTVDQIWNFKPGSSKAFLSNIGLLMLNINPSIKEGQLLGKVMKSFSSKGQPLTNTVSVLNNKQYKTLTNLFSAQKTSPPSWKQIEQLFVSLGCNVEERAGSRIAVILKDKERVFHVPHSHHQTDKWLLTEVRKFLKEIEALPLDGGSKNLAKF